MSKSTKIIAALGVVAGIGAAALPMASYAETSSAPYNVSGNVDLYVEVPEAIAMTITGNNDNDAYDDPNEAAHGAINVFSGFNATGANPLTAGTVDGHTVNASTTVKSSSYTTLSQNAAVNGESADAAGSYTDGKTPNGFASTITVYTNAANGYNLSATGAQSINDGAAEPTYLAPDLKNGNYSIAANGTVTAGTSGWGYKAVKYMLNGTEADNEDTATEPAANAEQVIPGSYSAMPAYGTTNIIDTLGKATKNGRKTVVLYGVGTASDQAAGVYKTTLLYTATTK